MQGLEFRVGLWIGKGLFLCICFYRWPSARVAATDCREAGCCPSSGGICHGQGSLKHDTAIAQRTSVAEFNAVPLHTRARVIPLFQMM